MAINYNTSIVRAGLVLYFDAANPKCYQRTNLAGAWTDYASHQADYTMFGSYDVMLKTSYASWVGQFPITFSSAGRYYTTFDYWSDADGSVFAYNNDGVHDNAFNGSLTANKAKQSCSVFVDVTVLGAMQFYFARSSGGNIFISNFKIFKESTTITDLSGTGNNGTMMNSLGYTNGSFTYADTTKDAIIVPLSSTIQNLKTSQGGNGLTFFVWAKSTAAAGNWRKLIGNGDGDNYIDVYQHPAGTYACECASTLYVDNVQYGSGVFTMANSGWHCYAGTNLNSGTLTNPANNLAIGCEPSLATYDWYGNIAAVMLYNRVLSSAEMTQNFNALRGRFGL